MNAFPLPPTPQGVHWSWWAFVGCCVLAGAVAGWSHWRARQRAVEGRRAKLLPSFERECRIIRAYVQGKPDVRMQDAADALRRLHLKTAVRLIQGEFAFRGGTVRLPSSVLQVAVGVFWGLSSSDLALLLNISKSYVYRQRKELRDALQLRDDESLESAVLELFGSGDPVKYRMPFGQPLTFDLPPQAALQKKSSK